VDFVATEEGTVDERLQIPVAVVSAEANELMI
jgi:hypothetical protein